MYTNKHTVTDIQAYTRELMYITGLQCNLHDTITLQMKLL